LDGSVIEKVFGQEKMKEVLDLIHPNEQDVITRWNHLSYENQLWGIEYMDGANLWPSTGKQHPWEPPRVTFERKNRRERLKALGNAVVPQVVTFIGWNLAEFIKDKDES